MSILFALLPVVLILLVLLWIFLWGVTHLKWIIMFGTLTFLLGMSMCSELKSSKERDAYEHLIRRIREQQKIN
jgi:hypothetical protein